MAKRNLRKLLAAVSAVGLFGQVTSAAVFDDAANGAWENPATWGSDSATPGDGDTVIIDSNTVSISKVVGATITGNFTIDLSGGQLTVSYDTNIPAAATLNTSGGTFSNSRGKMFEGGVVWNVSGTTTYHTSSNGETSYIGNTGLTTSTVMHGDGTIIKTGVGTLNVRSVANVADGDTNTPGNQPRYNPSTFSGTWIINGGRLEVVVPEFSKFATVHLGGTVEGTIDGTDRLVSPQFSNSTNGGTFAGTQLEVKNLTGTGRINWANTGGYYRDLAVSGYLDPGTPTEAGLIKRDTQGSTNDLVMRPDSIMYFDVFSPTSADKVDWTDSVGLSGVVFNEAHLKIRLFEPTEATGLLSWILIDADEWISKGSQGSGTGTAIESQTFASIEFLAADGSPLNLWDGTDGDSGWTNLDIRYLGEMGSGNRQVQLVGEYVVPVPEPAGLGVLAIGALGLLRRRRMA